MAVSKQSETNCWYQSKDEAAPVNMMLWRHSFFPYGHEPDKDFPS